MGEPTGWQCEARQLRAQGHGANEIAALDGQPRSAVREVLRGTRRPPAAVLGAGAKLVEPHAPRVPRVTLDHGFGWEDSWDNFTGPRRRRTTCSRTSI